MGLSFGKKSSGGSGPKSSIKLDDGVFANKATIAQAAVDYDCSMFENSEYKDEVALFMKLDQEGLTFQKDLYIGGNFKKEGGQRVDWGSAFKVKRVFDVLGIEGELDDDGNFTQETIDALVGHEIHFLQYSSKLKDDGKPRYSDYRIVDAARSAEDTDQAVADRLLASFKKDVDGGWLKNYKPASVLREEAKAATQFDVVSNGLVEEESPF